jgi:hypothetical protein
MSDVRTVYARARAETAKLLGHGDDLDNLSPEASTRLDVACALRIALDDQAAKLLRGESADVAKLLSASEALGKLLPAAVLASPPPANAPDARQIMLETYMEMRRRGELAASHLSPQQRLEAARAKVALIEAELAASTAITPPTSDIVPPGEWRGVPPMPGPDDPPRRSSQVIEGKVNPTPPRAAPQPQAAPTGILTDGGGDEPWRPFCGGGPGYDRWSNRN